MSEKIISPLRKAVLLDSRWGNNPGTEVFEWIGDEDHGTWAEEPVSFYPRPYWTAGQVIALYESMGYEVW